MNILFVCAGNTCRSPMAEAILARVLCDKLGHQGISVSSAGICATPGQHAANHAKDTVRAKGLDLDGHRARRLDQNIVAAADLVLTMTDDQACKARERLGPEAQVFTIADYATGASEDVRDPFNDDLAEYERCYCQLERLAQGVADKLLCESAS